MARLLRPQGRRGEILAEPETDLPVFTPGQRLWLTPGVSGEPILRETLWQPTDERSLESAWQPTGRNAGRLVLKLTGSNSIEEAERLAHHVVLLPETALPALENDTFFTADLIGCTLFDGERPAGTVVDVQFPVGADGRTRLPDAPDLLAVLPPPLGPEAAVAEAEPALVPFVRAWLVRVDLAARRIVMHLPPGLFDSE